MVDSGGNMRRLRTMSFLGLLAGCGGAGEPSEPGGPPGSQNGSIAVTITSSGPDHDPDGYMLSLDGDTGRQVELNDAFTLDNVSAGSHTLTLRAVAANCTVAESNAHTVTVSAGGSVPAEFSVTCVA